MNPVLGVKFQRAKQQRMRGFLFLSAALILAFHSTAGATEPQHDYGNLRGVCHTGWSADTATVDRELGYAKRLQFNSVRIWLHIQDYEANPTLFIDKLRNYVRRANALGISTMPILFNGNGLNPTMLQQSFHQRGDAYVNAVVSALKDEPGLFIWDIMNEPTFNDYFVTAKPVERPARMEEMNQFLRYYLKLVKSLDPKNATTVGHAFANDLDLGGDLVDVLSFHEYSDTRSRIERSYVAAERASKKYNKPLINSELGCVSRGNPYDLALNICQEHKVGSYVFELMIRGYWSNVQGLVYPDGTVRDPSIIAALYGFERNRDQATMIPEVANREGSTLKAIREIDDAIMAAAKSENEQTTDRILEAAEHAANLLEAAQLVPMHDPPTAKILTWRKMTQKNRDVAAIRAFATRLRDLLKANSNAR